MSFRSWFESVKSICNLGRADRRPCRRSAPRARLRLECLETRLALSTFTVVNILDTPAHSSYVPPGSLRDAVNHVNADPQPGIDTINFAIGSGPQTIKLGYYALNTIRHSVVIDGTSQSGYAGKPLIELDGTTASYNGGNGLFISAGHSTVKGMVINRFHNDGILLTGPVGGDIVAGNYIGTDVTGTVALANGGAGVRIYNSAHNTIGGTTAGAANLIAYNAGDGMRVYGGTGNAIQQNSIFANGGLGIDLQGGANNSQAAPALTSAVSSNGSTAVAGTLTSGANTSYTLEFFGNPSGTGQGKTFLGFITVTTDATGKAAFTSTFAVTLAPGQVITATATDPLGDTSEFSAGVAAT
jgi:hypothetical protein